MTRSEFIVKFRYEIEGWVLDGAMEARRGAELSIWLRQIRERIGEKLGEMFDVLDKKERGAMP